MKNTFMNENKKYQQKSKLKSVSQNWEPPQNAKKRSIALGLTAQTKCLVQIPGIFA